MKLPLFLFFILTNLICIGQTTDTIVINFDKAVYEQVLKDSLISRYTYTKDKAIKEGSLDVIECLNKHPVHKIQPYLIPRFNFKSDKIKDYICGENIEQYIDFENVEFNGQVILVSDEKYIGYFHTSFYVNQLDFFNSIFFESCGESITLSSSGIYYNKLIMEKKSFIFDLPGFSGHFIIDEGILYFISNPYGNFTKTPANDYIINNIGKQELKDIAIYKGRKRRKNMNRYKPCLEKNYSFDNYFIKVNYLD